MEEERMKYPLAYVYSLVGRVVKCEENVEDFSELVGKLVFTFLAHASQVIVDCSAIQIVPDGIDRHDTIFLSSVETALALVQDARPNIGEKVDVFGQGLIGLWEMAVLKSQTLERHSDNFGTVSTFDTIHDRLVASVDMGASQVLLPNQFFAAGTFDVATEVSRNGRALQSAIDATRDSRRIIAGSWCGKDAVHLHLLGIGFHQRHKQLKASQVSVLPADMAMTWTNSRWFALTWELVRQLSPLQLITKKAAFLQCQEVYEALAAGMEICRFTAYEMCSSTLICKSMKHELELDPETVTKLMVNHRLLWYCTISKD